MYLMFLHAYRAVNVSVHCVVRSGLLFWVVPSLNTIHVYYSLYKVITVWSGYTQSKHNTNMCAHSKWKMYFFILAFRKKKYQYLLMYVAIHLIKW